MLVTKQKMQFQKIVGRCLLMLALAIFFILPLFAQAQGVANSQQSSGLAADTAGLTSEEFGGNVNLPDTDLRLFIARLINVTLGLLGIILLGLISYAGWLYMTSEGDADKTNKAKAILRNAIVGLLIILSSWSIAYFVLNALWGSSSGTGSTNRPGSYDVGVAALGDGIIQSHYPKRGQTGVPRNTTIIITFKEALSLDSICGNNNANSPCDLDQTAIKIFETPGGSELSSDKDAAEFAAGASVTTRDNKTFVFKPKSYLGTPSKNQWYGVRLNGDVLKKANGDEVVLSAISDNFYQWKFQVSTELDVTPPAVTSIFPQPDNTQDMSGEIIGATKASAMLEVNGVPDIYKAEQIKATGATIIDSSQYSCLYQGQLVYQRGSTSDYPEALIMVSKVFDVGFLTTVKIINGSIANIGCGLALNVSDMNIGAKTTVTINPEQQADTLIIGARRYVFGQDIKIFDTDNNKDVADNIVAALTNNTDVTARIGNPNNIVILTAKVSGQAGNSIRLSSSNTQVIQVPSSLSGGTDAQENIEVKDQPDQPRNAVIQINFDEAMNPIQLQGNSDDIKDYIQVRVKNSDDATTLVGGEFIISNNYQTVEFRSKDACGENMCGEPRYCLPANANIEVFVKAAGLYSCSSNNDCADVAGFFGAYPTCSNNICNEDGVNNSQANTSLDGVMDVAFNSLDGNNDNNAQGPASDFYANNPNPDNTVDGADNYKWSFWVSDKIDNTSPVITQAIQGDTSLVQELGEQSVGISTSTPLIFGFDKLMMSSTLKAGRNYPNDFYIVPEGEPQMHKEYFVFAKFTGWPLGYWIEKINLDTNSDGYDDQTEAIINHTSFADNAAYGFVAGSGLQDIYQNCYNPAADQQNCKNLNAGISCCKGVPTNGPNSMCYDFE